MSLAKLLVSSNKLSKLLSKRRRQSYHIIHYWLHICDIYYTIEGSLDWIDRYIRIVHRASLLHVCSAARSVNVQVKQGINTIATTTTRLGSETSGSTKECGHAGLPIYPCTNNMEYHHLGIASYCLLRVQVCCFISSFRPYFSMVTTSVMLLDLTTSR